MREYLGLQVPDDIDDFLIEQEIGIFDEAGYTVDETRKHIRGRLGEWVEWTECEKAAAKLLAKLESGDSFRLEDLLRPLLFTPLETGYDSGDKTHFCLARQGTPPRGMIIVAISHNEAWYVTHGEADARRLSFEIAQTFINLIREKIDVQYQSP